MGAAGTPLSQIMREQIMKQINGDDVCSRNWSVCLRTATNPIKKSQCDVGRGGCQLAGAIGQAMNKESLNEAIRQYKSQCER